MKRVIVDVDAGTDDAFALFLLLHADKIGKIKLEFISCSAGNTNVGNVAKNVIRILELAKRTDIPVYKGSHEQLLPPYYKHDEQFHGNDGFGDLIYESEPDVSIVKDKHAAISMGEFVLRNPKQISLITLGPLTTVALAFKLFPKCGENLAEIAIMGGNNKAVGNTPNSAEFNFYYDPEAAYIILEKAKCPITMLPWETSLIPKISMDWRIKVLGNVSNPVLELITRAETKCYEKFNSDLWICCDGFLVAAFLYPECIKKQETFHGTVELHGFNTRGQLVLDHRYKNKPNVIIIEDICEDVIKNVSLKAAMEMD